MQKKTPPARRGFPNKIRLTAISTVAIIKVNRRIHFGLRLTDYFHGANPVPTLIGSTLPELLFRLPQVLQRGFHVRLVFVAIIPRSAATIVAATVVAAAVVTTVGRILLTHERARVLSQFLTHTVVAGEKFPQLRVILQVPWIINQARIPRQIRADLL